MSVVLEKPGDGETAEAPSLEDRYQRLSDEWPDRKVELIDDRIVVREVPTTEHARLIFRLLLQLIPLDTFAERVRLLSRPGEKGYGHEVEVRLGEPLELPAPWSLTLDTVALTA